MPGELVLNALGASDLVSIFDEFGVGRGPATAVNGRDGGSTG